MAIRLSETEVKIDEQLSRIEVRPPFTEYEKSQVIAWFGLEISEVKTVYPTNDAYTFVGMFGSRGNLLNTAEGIAYILDSTRDGRVNVTS